MWREYANINELKGGGFVKKYVVSQKTYLFL